MKPIILLGASLLLLGGPPALADSLKGQDTLVCSASQVHLCTADGICEAIVPREMQIPQFVLVDLKKQQLATTLASGENRKTRIRSTVREDGQISLQGVDRGRAFSLVISEVTGSASIAIALEDISIGVFGACTPTPVR